MSTVDLKTAQKVIEGEFPEDGIVGIIRYENQFNGNFAFKLCYDKKQMSYLLTREGRGAMIEPEIYWTKEFGMASRFVEKKEGE